MTPITCLIAEDHDLMRHALAAFLEAEPGIVLEGVAPDGQTLLGLLEERTRDVVVVDVHMPGLGGLEVCEQVGERFPGVHVILYTGNDEVGLLEEAIVAGARGFVVKSGVPVGLTQAMTMAMQERIFIDATLMGALLRRVAAQHPGTVFSARELDVLGVLAEGGTTGDAARTLLLSPLEARSAAESALAKLDASGVLIAVAGSLRSGLLV